MGIITFIEGKVPLRKQLAANSTRSYPNVKHIKSHIHEYAPNNDGLEEKYRAVQNAAKKNWAQYRGNFVEPLEWESRKGKTDRDAPNSTLVFDLDGLELPDITLKTKNNTAADVQYAAERFIRMLPEAFHEASYIAHASSSWGRKGDKVCMHIEFEMATAVMPRVLKNWLCLLNLNIPAVKERCVLSNSKSALSFPIDPSMADNSRIIYIAAPEFVDQFNPFADDEERTVLIKKTSPTLSVHQIISATSPDSVEKLKKKHINSLRKKEGLNTYNPKTVTLISMGEQVKVITNPDAMNMQLVSMDDKAGFARWNVNGGDSAAYFTHLHSPNIVYNFKGEDPFDFAKADPETYAKFLDEYGKQIGQANPLLPLVFTDYDTANQYKCIYNLEMEDYCKNPAPIKGEQQIQDFYLGMGKVRPDKIEHWDYTFEPNNPRVLDFENKKANKYCMPAILRDPAPIVPWARGATYGEAHKLEMVAPWSYKLIHHMLGADDDAYEHFINWLAYCLQEKRLSATCWVITGTQGTGKGQFYERLLLPLFGKAHTAKFFIDAIEDQFNATSETRLMTVIDEFNIKNARNPQQMENKLKTLITEESVRIRGMRTEGRENVRSHNNWIVYSNDIDAHRIPANDRRYNVSPPQYVKLGVAFPDLNNRTKEKVDPEVGRFASFLLAFDYDYAMTTQVLDNKARHDMMMASKTWIERFFDAFLACDLEFFAEAIDPDFNPANRDIPLRIQARDVVTAWVKDADAGRATFVTSQQLHVVYNVRADRILSNDKFNSLQSKFRLPDKVRRRAANGARPRGWMVMWNIDAEELEHWVSMVDPSKSAPANLPAMVTISPTPPQVQ